MGNIAVITARSGSKGLKDKNIRLLNGKPLLAYTIDVAKESGCFSCIHVSTDSEKYAAIAREYGAEVPFLRDASLAGDTTGSWDVVRSVLEQYAQQGRSFERVMMLQPTSPLRTAEDIRNASALMDEKQAESVVGVCEADHSPVWSGLLPEDGNMNGFLKEVVPRQQIPVYYRINGAVYLRETGAVMSHAELYGPRTYAYIMPKERSADIDDIYDFVFVETLMRMQMDNIQ